MVEERETKTKKVGYLVRPRFHKLLLGFSTWLQGREGRKVSMTEVLERALELYAREEGYLK